MTKLRAPLSFEQAIHRIVGVIGWAGAAAAINRGRGRPITEGAVRKKADPDTQGSLTFEEAYLLDAAYGEAGGDGFPLHETYALRLQLSADERRASQSEIVLAAAKVAKETGEAVHAILVSTQPGATSYDRETATREVMEAHQALTAAVDKMGAGPIAASNGVAS